MQQPVTDTTRTMLLLTFVLSDGTQITLKETSEETSETCGDDVFPFSLIIAGKVECCYNSFEHAWEDFGTCVRCATLEVLRSVAEL